MGVSAARAEPLHVPEETPLPREKMKSCRVRKSTTLRLGPGREQSRVFIFSSIRIDRMFQIRGQKQAYRRG